MKPTILENRAAAIHAAATPREARALAVQALRDLAEQPAPYFRAPDDGELVRFDFTSARTCALRVFNLHCEPKGASRTLFDVDVDLVFALGAPHDGTPAGVADALEKAPYLSRQKLLGLAKALEPSRPDPQAYQGDWVRAGVTPQERRERAVTVLHEVHERPGRWFRASDGSTENFDYDSCRTCAMRVFGVSDGEYRTTPSDVGERMGADLQAMFGLSQRTVERVFMSRITTDHDRSPGGIAGALLRAEYA